MAGVNKVTLVGNLGNDPEVNVLENGVKVAKFSLATSESYKDKNTGERIVLTEWHQITLWRSLADISENYLKKGSQIYLEGKLQTKSYQDKEGNTRYSTSIIAHNLTMLDKKTSSEEDLTVSGNENISGSEMSNNDDLPF